MHPFDSALIAELRAADMDRVSRRGPRPEAPITVRRWRRYLGRLLVRAGQRIERPRPVATPYGPTGELATGRCV